MPSQSLRDSSSEGSQGAFADVEVKNTFSEGQTDEILSAQ